MPPELPEHEMAQRPKRLPEIVADQLQEYILKNGLRAADRLPTEPALAEMYAVSRQVVREAARLLEQRGVVDIRAGRGMNVADISVDGVRDIYRLFLRFKPENFGALIEARMILEPGTTALAAERRTDTDLTLMGGALDASNALDPDDHPGHLALDLEFHKHVTNASQNPFLIALCTPVNESLREVYAEPIGYLSSLPRTHAEHRKIFEAIVAQNPEAARLATITHLTRVREEARKLIPSLR